MDWSAQSCQKRRPRAPAIAWRHLALVISAFVATGCNTYNPSVPTPLVADIRMSGRPTIDIGETRTYRATATLADGSTRIVVGGAWGTDAPSIVRLGENGELTGWGHGIATIWVDYGGKRGTMVVTSRTNFTGTWRGLYSVSQCHDTFLFWEFGYCGFMRTIEHPITVSLRQINSGVNGKIEFGAPLGSKMTVDGTVYDNRLLRLDARPESIDNDITVSLLSWDSSLRGSEMRGRFERRFTSGSQSTLQHRGRLESLIRISGSPTLTSESTSLSGADVRYQLEPLRKR